LYKKSVHNFDESFLKALSSSNQDHTEVIITLFFRGAALEGKEIRLSRIFSNCPE
jgi:hypothetical protein